MGALTHGVLHFQTNAFQRNTKPIQNVDSNALPQPDQPEQQVLRADIGVIKAIRLFACQIDNLLRAWREIIEIIHGAPSA